MQPDVFLGPVCPCVLALIARYSTTHFLTVCVCSLMFSGHGGPLCAGTYSPLLLQTVCVCSLMFSWAGCAPMCWHLLAITLPHTYKLFACAAWSFPWPCVPLCAGSGGEIFCHTLTICLHLQPDVFLVPVCPYVLVSVVRYSATLLLIVCMCSLMFSWARCAPMCWLQKCDFLPHSYCLQL